MKQDIIKQLKEQERFIIFKSEDHTYTVDGDNYVSVTTLLKKYTPPFDPDGKILLKCANELGISTKQLKDEWNFKNKMACEKGTKIHLIFETMLEDRYESEDGLERLESVLKPIVDYLKPKLISCEQIMFNTQHMIAGTTDILTFNNDGTIDIWDIKTNNEDIVIDNKYNKYLLQPLQSVPNNKYYVYALQLNIYKYILENNGYKVKNLRLIHVKEKYYKLINLPVMDYEVGLIIKDVKI